MTKVSSVWLRPYIMTCMGGLCDVICDTSDLAKAILWPMHTQPIDKGIEWLRQCCGSGRIIWEARSGSRSGSAWKWKARSGSASKWKGGSLRGSWRVQIWEKESGRIRIRIRIKLKGRIRIRIHIRVKGRIRIRIKVKIRIRSASRWCGSATLDLDQSWSESIVI